MFLIKFMVKKKMKDLVDPLQDRNQEDQAVK